MVAAGNYPEALNLNDADDVGLTIDGAGTSTTGSGTVVQVPMNTNFVVRKSNMTIRDIAIEASNFETLNLGPLDPSMPITGQRLENVGVELNDQMNVSPAIRITNSNNAVLNAVQVSGDSMWHSGDAANALKVATSTNVVVNDSRFMSNSRTIHSRASTLTINRSLILGPIDLGFYAMTTEADVSGLPSSLVLDSSIVALGSRGIDVSSSGVGAPTTAVIRNSTIDPGMPKGTADLVGIGVTRVDTATVGIDNSIVVGSLTSGGPGGGVMTCTYSDVANTVAAAIACPTTAGNPGGNTSSTPASLFVPGGFLGLDWHLLSTSPAIDSGSPGALAPGESTTDFDGNARLVDGNFDCVARRDKGAYEKTGQSASCPTPGTNPAGGAPSQGSTKPKPKCKKRKKKSTRSAAAAKKRKCGKKPKR